MDNFPNQEGNVSKQTSVVIPDVVKPSQSEFIAPTLAPDQVMSLRTLLAESGVNNLLDVRLIEGLVGGGHIVIGDIEGFVARAKESRSTLPSLALKEEICSEHDLLLIEAGLAGWDICDLDQVEIEEGISGLIEPHQADSWKVLPYGRDELGNMLVAVGDPDGVAGMDNFQALLPREEIVWKLTPRSNLDRWIAVIYNPESSVSEFVAEADIGDQVIEDYTVRAAAIGAPIIRLVNDLIDQAWRLRSSDIHLEPTATVTNVRFRIDGMLREVTTIPRVMHPQVIARIKHLAAMRTDERTMPQDGRISMATSGGTVDLRVVTVPTVHGEQCTMRLLDPKQALLSLTELGMSAKNLERFNDAILLPHGCAFITGPTGSGKSTTLYAALAQTISSERKTITIEDPVEYRLPGITQIDVSRNAIAIDARRSFGFADALRASIRSDPDVIMVGEIRDKETASIAVDASITGHFLYSTLHTNDALSSIPRLEQLGVDRFLIAEAIEVIVAQRLIRILCPSCQQPVTAGPDYLRELRAPEWAVERAADEPFELLTSNHNGCGECSGIGFRGRIGVHEVIRFDEELREGIANGMSTSDLEKIVRSKGMDSIVEDSFERVRSGITSMEELARVVL